MKKKIVIIITSLLVLVLIVIGFKSCKSKETKVSLETALVRKSSVSTSVTATGTIEAIKTVAVGTRVSGEIRKIYVDYNSEVKAGQLLAELDRKNLTTALTIAEASLDNAKSEMTYQTSNYKRSKALFNKTLVAESDYDQALYTYEKAQAMLKTAQLNYDKSKIDLGYAYIYSPIDGVVLTRAVDEGQTVAASFSTPTLFSIANDLTRMQVEASIDEADIGQLKNNQRVEFTVDAYPNEKFEGKITQIRLEPVITSNVVTYTVIVEAQNPDKKLMPGMTASITIFVQEANDILVVASKALRFQPDPLLLKAYIESLPKNEPSKFDSEDVIHEAGIYGNDTTKKVWIKNGDNIHEVSVTTGINNDIDVEIQSGLQEGDEIVIAMSTDVSTKTVEKTASSPFMPTPPSSTTKKK
jgi:HlyD family secretion protein